MRKVVKYVMIVAVAIFAFAGIYYLFTNDDIQGNSIESDVFFINEWNTPGYIADNEFTISKGEVVKNMPSDSPRLFDAIVDVESSVVNEDGTHPHYLVYFVDTLEREVGDSILNETAIMVGSYHYDYSVDEVKRILVYVSKSGIEFLQEK